MHDLTGICENCKFWDNDLFWDANCQSDERMRDQRECLHPKPLWSAHGEGVLMEGLATKPSFGCIQFEAK